MNYGRLLNLVDTDKKAAFREVGLALNERPEDPRLIALYAILFQRDDNCGLAYNLWKRVLMIEKNPETAILNNMGLSAAMLGPDQYQQEAERYFKRVLELEPKNIPSLNNLALFALHNGDYARCLKLCEKSLAAKPYQAEVHETRAYANLMLGRWKEGWEDWDFSIGSKYRPNIGDEPYWCGEKGARLHLRGEQGIGDEISFASVIPDAVKDNDISLECDHRLEGLFKRSFPGIRVHGTRFKADRSWYEPHDYRALLGSLCRHYRNAESDFPGTPYLVADPDRRIQWRALLDRLPGKKIGIAWTGGKANTFADRRSFQLEDWLPILKTDNTFVSLQYKDPSGELEVLKERHGIEVKHYPWATMTQDYDDTAALVAELDLVICATTAVVHLCGALGKECWVLAPKRSRWLYGKEGRSIPWYKSIEVFRQQKEWPIQEVAERLGRR